MADRRSSQSRENTERTKESSSSSTSGDGAKEGRRIEREKEYARMVDIAKARKQWSEYVQLTPEETMKAARDTYQKDGILGFNFLPECNFRKAYGTKETETAYYAFQASEKYKKFITEKGDKATADAELDQYPT